MDRRQFLKQLTLGLATPYVLVACGPNPRSSSTTDAGPPVDPDAKWFELDASKPSAAVFSLSVASGDPTVDGVMLWTRVAQEAVTAGVKLAVEVARDEQFAVVTARAVVDAASISADHDFTVRVDLAGHLAANTRYYYRFIYNRTASQVGRCRTLPAADAELTTLSFAVVTCQDFTNGYYGAFDHIANDEVDFVIHLGDFIYESAADPRFQSLPFADREVVLPSGEQVAMDLDDYRSIYRRYRSDLRLQRAMEQHTWLMIWDDHETANDCYWDADNDRLGAPDHPLNDQPTKLNALKIDSQRAWTEYVPARVTFDAQATHPHDALAIQRSFTFGTLAHLVMTDERTYRSAHACGEGAFGERYAAACPQTSAPTQTMLGNEQVDWFLDEMKRSTALWKLWGNEVLLAPLTVPKFDRNGIIRDAQGNMIYVSFSTDAWDGFDSERQHILDELKSADVKNVLVLTGDLHSSVVAYVKQDPRKPNGDLANIVAVEMMTPSVTSSNLSEIVRNQTGVGLTGFVLQFIMSGNPHLLHFDVEQWGYSILTLTQAEATFKIYSVDKSKNDNAMTRSVLKTAKITAGTLSTRTI